MTCPFCGEDRQIEQISKTLARWFCNVCGKSWTA